MANTTKKKPKEKLDIRQINFGNVPPQALEMEECVIGSMLINKDAISALTGMLKPEFFYDERNEKIYAAIVQLFVDKSPVDTMTVTEKLRSNGDLDNIGGIEHIAELTQNVRSGTHLEYYAKVISQKFYARELIRIATETQSSAFDEKTDIDELIQETQGKVFEISKGTIKREVRQINPYIDEAVHRIQEAAQRGEGLSGVSSGFPEVDRVTYGWQASDLIIIAARPAMGKTAFILSMIKNIAIDGVKGVSEIERIPCAMFSLEMSSVQLVNRLLINVCQIPGDTIKRGQLSQEEWHRLDAGVQKMHDAPIYIDDTPQLSILEFRTKAMRLVAEHGVRIIFIDYLQLMNAQGMSFFSREGEVSLISRNLKGLAKELNIPIIALSQLNRNLEKRGDSQNAIEGRKPQLSDLRESGAIEQDADIVAFIHRPEYYKIYDDGNGTDFRGVGQFLIAKHRNGSTEDINLIFRKEYAQFASKNSEIEKDMNDGFLSSKTNVSQSYPDIRQTFVNESDGENPLPY